MKKSTSKEKSGNAKCTFGEKEHLALIEAVKNDHESEVSSLIDVGVDVNITDESGRNGLTYAITNGSKSMVDLLIKAGADVNAIHDSYGQTPLSDAAANGNESIIAALIGAGADVNKTNKNTARTALFNAVGKNRYSVVDVLINAGAEVNIRESFGETPLFSAISDEQMVHKLLDAGIDVNITNRSGKTAIFGAVMLDKDNIVHVLINAGIDVNITDYVGRTALFDAVDYAKSCKQVTWMGDKYKTTYDDDDSDNDAYSEMITLVNECMAIALIDAGTDVNKVDKHGQTALFFAVLNEDEKMTNALIDAGTDVNIVNINGQTALFFAVFSEDEKFTCALIKAGADVNIANNDGDTALLYAVKRENERLGLALIQAGADVNVHDPDKMTALMHTSMCQDKEKLVYALINAGAHVNCTDIVGETALFCAVRIGYESYTRALVGAGADVNITNQEGKTPLHVSFTFRPLGLEKNQNATANIIRTLITDGNASVNARDIYGRTPLFYGCSKSVDATLYLLENGGNLHLKDNCNMDVMTFFIEKSIQDQTFCMSKGSNSSDFWALLLLLKGEGKDQKYAEVIINFVFCITPLVCNSVLGRYLSHYKIPMLGSINGTSICCALLEASEFFNEIDNQKVSIVQTILELLDKEDICVISKVLALLAELGAKPNCVDSSGNTALHYATLLACSYGESKVAMEVCCQLEEIGITFNIKNQQHENPLLFCLDRGSCVCRVDNENDDEIDGQLPVCSIIKAIVEVCKFLIKNGVTVDGTSAESGMSVFHLIIKFFQVYFDLPVDKDIKKNTFEELLELLKLFLLADAKVGVLVNKSDNNLNTPLHYWATLALKSVPDYGIDVTTHCAFEELIRDIFKLLLESGAKLNQRNVDEETPLHRCRTWSAVKLLLDAGANPNDVDSSGNTPLLAAPKNGFGQQGSGIIKDKFTKDGYIRGKDCFYPDVTEDSKTFWKTAIEKQLDPWAVNKQGESVLSILTASEEFVLAKALIDVACEENYVQSDTVAVSLLNALCEDKSTRTHWKGILVKTILKSRKSQTNIPGPLHHCCRNILEFGMFEDEQRETELTPQIEQGKSSLSENPSSCDDEEQQPPKKRKKNERKTSTECKNKQTKYNSVHCEIAKQLILYGADCRSPDSSGRSCLKIAEGIPSLIDFLTRPISIDEVPTVIPWTSVSQKFESILAKVARRQECKFINTLWHHKDHIGSGSFGHIFAGINEKDGREVAIKRIEKVRMQRPEDKREIENLLIVADSEKAVRYLSFFEDENFSYLVLELMEGDLDSYLQDRALYPRDDVQLCKDVLVGLRYLHEQNVIHRDLKPSNILYKAHPKLCLKIADFGLSRRIDSISTTVYSTNVGTRCWIAPEVLKSTKDHSISSDTFACGLVLHYIFSAGKHPFSPASCAKKSDSEINNETEANVLNGRMEGWDNSISPEATHLIKKMLESDASKPRPTAAEALDHPLFWSKKRKIDFLTAVGNQPEFECPRAKRRHPLTAVETDLDKMFSTVVKYATWIDPGCIRMPAIYTEMTKRRKSYDTKSLAELVRFIRNAYAHVSDIKRPTAIRKYILEDFVFLDYFPNLVIEVFKSVTSHGWDQTRDEIKCKMNK